MQLDRRKLMIAASLAGLGNALGASGEESGKGLYRTASPEAILTASRALITSDTIGTLITVDASGQPRARSIFVSAPDSDMGLWMGTRPGSRKLEQLAANPRATLHFAEDTKGLYVSLMGEARTVADPAVVAAKNPYKGALLKAYFPNFPKDFVLLSFKPHYLEIMTETILGTKETWQPQGLVV
jgi:general stress protein 26